MRANPDLEAGYRRLIRGWLIYGNIPWFIMGAGIVFGEVGSVFEFFNPRHGPFVVAFYISVVVLWVLASYWLFFRGGAEELITYPGLLNLPIKKPWVIKVFFVFSFACGVVGLALMILGDFAVPTFK